MLSLIIIVYNRLNLLDLCLTSLEKQTIQPDELIISDDGSDDDVLSYLKERTAKFDFNVNYVRQEHNGFRAAKCRNNAIRIAEGEYIIFMDQDVVGTKKYLETYLNNKNNGQFLVAYPIYLTEEQTNHLDASIIEKNEFSHIYTLDQYNERIKKQFRKDRYYAFETRYLRLNGFKPKIRAGAFGIYKEDLMRVDGFDENYQFGGQEDDDLGRRLYKAGIRGKNVFLNEFPLHLYHPPNRIGTEDSNRAYYEMRKKEIKKGHFIAPNGVSNPLGDDQMKVVRIK